MNASVSAAGNAARNLITTLNQAWQTGDMATVSASYHPHAILLPPDLGPVIRGRDAIVETYAAFNRLAKLRHFEVTDTELFDFDSSQALHVKFTLAYQLDGATLEDKGLDVYLISPQGDGLSVVWRQQVVLASGELTD